MILRSIFPHLIARLTQQAVIAHADMPPAKEAAAPKAAVQIIARHFALTIRRIASSDDAVTGRPTLGVELNQVYYPSQRLFPPYFLLTVNRLPLPIQSIHLAFSRPIIMTVFC